MQATKPGKALRLFCAVLALNFVYSLVTFFLYFDSRESNFSSAVYSLLRLIPLVVLIVLCVRMRNITDTVRLSVIKKCLIAYLAIDALLGLVTFRFSLPRPIGCLFYAKGWWFCNNKPLTRNREGLWINIVCLVLSEAQVFLMW